MQTRTYSLKALVPGGLLVALLVTAYSCSGEPGEEPGPGVGAPTPPVSPPPAPTPTTPPVANPPPVTPPITNPPPVMPPGMMPPPAMPPGMTPPPVMPPGMMPPPVMPPDPPAAEPPACQDADAKLNGLKLVTVATANLPIHLVGHPSDPDTALIAQRGGAVRVAKGLRNATTPVELSEPILNVATTGNNGERGLLSIALHPNDPTRLFVFYNDSASGFDTVVQEFKRNLETGMATAGKVHYRAVHTAGNHQGGQVAFGADKMLYFTVGDNGGGGQARSTMLNNNFGKVLRIDPDTGMAPPGNHMGLIWAYGLRNPFRMSFDRKTGDLYIGDVGEGTEEVNFQPAGKAGVNYGWSGGGAGDGAPLVRYTRQNGFAVIGGYVYRGTKNGCMAGRYFFADRARGPAHSVLVQNGSLVAGSERTHAALTNSGIYSFGEDGAGEVYMLYGNASGRVARISE